MFCLLLQFLQLFNLLFQLFDSFAVVCKLLQIGGGGGESRFILRNGETAHIELFGAFCPAFRLTQRLKRRVELLRFDLGQSSGKSFADFEVFPCAEIMKRTSLQVGAPFRLADDILVELRGFLIAGKLFFPGGVVKFFRRIRQFRFDIDSALRAGFRFCRNCRNRRTIYRHRNRRNRRKIFRLKPRPAKDGEQQQRRLRNASPGLKGAFGNQKIDQQQSSCRDQSQRKFFNRDRAFSSLLFGLVEPFDPVFHRGQSGVGYRAAHVDASGFRSQPSQIDLVEPGGN